MAIYRPIVRACVCLPCDTGPRALVIAVRDQRSQAQSEIDEGLHGRGAVLVMADATVGMFISADNGRAQDKPAWPARS